MSENTVGQPKIGPPACLLSQRPPFFLFKSPFLLSVKLLHLGATRTLTIDCTCPLWAEMLAFFLERDQNIFFFIMCSFFYFSFPSFIEVWQTNEKCMYLDYTAWYFYRCTMWWFSTHTHCELIATIKSMNTSIVKTSKFISSSFIEKWLTYITV